MYSFTKVRKLTWINFVEVDIIMSKYNFGGKMNEKNSLRFRCTKMHLNTPKITKTVNVISKTIFMDDLLFTQETYSYFSGLIWKLFREIWFWLLKLSSSSH